MKQDTRWRALIKTRFLNARKTKPQTVEWRQHCIFFSGKHDVRFIQIILEQMQQKRKNEKVKAKLQARECVRGREEYIGVYQKSHHKLFLFFYSQRRQRTAHVVHHHHFYFCLLFQIFYYSAQHAGRRILSGWIKLRMFTCAEDNVPQEKNITNLPS